jgi:hypothetical protein
VFRLFIANANGTFFGMSESLEASTTNSNIPNAKRKKKEQKSYKSSKGQESREKESQVRTGESS